MLIFSATVTSRQIEQLHAEAGTVLAYTHKGIAVMDAKTAQAWDAAIITTHESQHSTAGTTTLDRPAVADLLARYDRWVTHRRTGVDAPARTKTSGGRQGWHRRYCDCASAAFGGPCMC